MTISQRLAKADDTGVSLIELLVVLGIMGIFTTLVIPGFRGLMLDIQRDTAIRNIVVAFAYARSEAIKRNQSVTVCPFQEGASCRAVPHWEHGWLVYLDANVNGQRDDGELVLRQSEDRSGGMTLRGVKTRVVYKPHGGSEGWNGTIKICDQRGAPYARSIILSNSGRVRIGTSSTCP